MPAAHALELHGASRSLSTARNKNRRTQSASRQPALAKARRLKTPSYPFTGMVTGFASLNVNLLLAARRVTFLFALALSVCLASFLVWLFGPTIELVSRG